MDERKNIINKRIKYFVGYDAKECYSENRDVSTAAMTKATYICKKLNQLGYGVDIVSNAVSKNDSGFYMTHRYKLSELNYLYITPSIGGKGVIYRAFNRWLSNMWLFLYGMFNLKRNETIIVYHGLAKEKVILWLKRLKALTLILEAEELYQNVGKPKRKMVKLENRVMEKADKFIVITEELNRIINKKNREYCVLNGTYEYIARDKKRNNEYIKLVYAGTFNAEKGGVYKAIDVMDRLPDNFNLDILGFGTDKEVEDVKKYISKKDKRENINYIGLKRDQDFLNHLCNCDIGLSTQNSQGSYNGTSFPSKILTYICCGLKVVSVKTQVVENSDVSSCVVMYEDRDINELANAIILAQKQKIDCRESIERLDMEFTLKLEDLLKL